MKFTQVACLSLFIILLLVFPKAIAQKSDSDIIESLNQHIIPISTFQPDSNFQDIDFLKGTLKDKHVVGLGEATHGTHEFFKYKDRLIRYLVTNLDFKAIAFESDFMTLQILNNYISGKTDEMYFSGGFPVSAETRALLKWLKEYNQQQPVPEKVHIYGLEARGFKNISKLLIDSLTNLSEVNKKTLLKVYNTSNHLLTKKDISELKLIIPSLYESAVQQTTSRSHKHYVKLLEQGVSHFLKSSKDQIGLRDEHMFENALWIKESTANKKLIIWAHNGHLAKSNIYWQSPLGKHLYQEYGDKYYVIATDFNHGEVGVYVQENKEFKYQNVYYPEVSTSKGYEFFFSKCKFSNFFIDVQESSKNPNLQQFLTKSREMRAIGGTDKPSVSKLSISECFDLVAFFNKATASK